MKGVVGEGQIAAPYRGLPGGEVKAQRRPFVAQQVMDYCKGSDIARNRPVVCKPSVELEVWQDFDDASGERTEGE